MKKKKFKPKRDLPKTMTVEQIASCLQISRSTAYGLVRSNGFPKIRIGKRMLIPRDAFDLWVTENTKMTYGEID